MRLNPQAFNRHLDHMGQVVSWRQAYACPCKNPHSGAADTKCPQCFGKGWLWTAALEGVVGVPNQKTQREWAQYGMWESGDMVVSIPENSPVYEIGQADRIVMLNATDRFSLTLTHGAQTERLIGMIEKVTRVFWLDAQKNIVEGGIPAVADNGTLTWSSGEPPAGKQYAINGTRFNEYFCWGPYPSDRNEHKGARLPRRVVLRKFDLWGRGPSASPA